MSQHSIKPGKYTQTYPDGTVEEFEIVYRDNKPRIIESDESVARSFRRKEADTMSRVEPLGTAEQAEIVPIGNSPWDIDDPTVERRRYRRNRYARKLRDESIPEWKRRAMLYMKRFDI